jgi:hypothetical protein
MLQTTLSDLSFLKPCYSSPILKTLVGSEGRSAFYEENGSHVAETMVGETELQYSLCHQDQLNIFGMKCYYSHSEQFRVPSAEARRNGRRPRHVKKT